MCALMMLVAECDLTWDLGGEAVEASVTLWQKFTKKPTSMQQFCTYCGSGRPGLRK
jgi:hypothetical protein